MIILGLDPGTITLGWCVLDDARDPPDELVGFGVIESKKVEHCRKFLHIDWELKKVARQYRIDEVACEIAIRFENKRIPALEYCVTVIKHWAAGQKLPITTYTATEWKKSSVGNWKAGKDETIEKMSLLFPQLAGAGEHVADAVGIGLAHSAVLKVRRLAGEL